MLRTVQPYDPPLVDSFIKPISTLGDGFSGLTGSPFRDREMRLYCMIQTESGSGHGAADWFNWSTGCLPNSLHDSIVWVLDKRTFSKNSSVPLKDWRRQQQKRQSRFRTGQLLTANGAAHFTHSAARY